MTRNATFGAEADAGLRFFDVIVRDLRALKIILDLRGLANVRLRHVARGHLIRRSLRCDASTIYCSDILKHKIFNLLH